LKKGTISPSETDFPTGKQKIIQDIFDWAVALLLAEARLGELLKGIPDKYSTKFHGGKLVSLPKGITHKQSHYVQEIKKHLGELLPPPSFQRGKDGRVTGHSTEIVSVGNGSYKTICIDPPWPRSNLIMHIEMF
jgi:hypothetical protein